MIIDNPTISGSALLSGSLTITGSLNVSGSISGLASNAVSASYALISTSASYALVATSASQANNADTATSASYALASTSASYSNNSTSASYALNATSASQANNADTATSASYALNATTSSYALNSTTSSFALNATSASYALVSTSASYAANSDLLDGRDSLTFANTGSNAFVGTQNINGSVAITGSLTTTGVITAQTLNVQQVTSSIVYSSGSNIFGNSVSNTQSMTGSVGISGSLAVTGASTITGILTLNSTITNGTYTYTLPSATGTLALTSALTGYLPLTGGTLTGALSGTSATFTAAVNPLILKSTNASTMYTEYYYNTSTLSGYIGSGTSLLTGANNSDFIIRSEADFVVATGGNNRRLTIASTGVATFASSAAGLAGMNITNSSATSYGLDLIGGDATRFALRLRNYDASITALTVTGAGAVTAPNQIGFKAYISGANPSASKGASNTIPYNATTYNYGSGFSTSTYIFTAPVAGRYLFVANVNTYTNDSTATYLIRFYKNSALYSNGLSIVLPTGNTGDIVNSVSQIIDLALNDTVYMVLNNSGSGTYYYSAGASYNSFSGQLLS